MPQLKPKTILIEEDEDKGDSLVRYRPYIAMTFLFALDLIGAIAPLRTSSAK